MAGLEFTIPFIRGLERKNLVILLEALSLPLNLNQLSWRWFIQN